jgi:hypothetical protein
MDRGPSSRTLSAGTPVSGNRTESPSLTTPARRSSTDSTVNALSPMHPPKAVHRDEEDEVVVTDEASWVGRKVDALFSPVLSFLNNAAEDSLRDAPTASTVSTAEGTSPTNENVNISSSLDDEESLCDSMVAMEDVEDEDEFNPWQFIKCLPDYAYVRHLCPPITLPPKTAGAPPITLVLDLDETLVHCTVEPVENADLTFPVDFHNVTYQVHVRLRPHLFTFLSRIEGQYEIVLFTASQKVYANELLNRIDPGTWDGERCRVTWFRLSVRSPNICLILCFSVLLCHRRKILSPPSVSGVLFGSRRQLPQRSKRSRSRPLQDRSSGQLAPCLWIPSRQRHSH